MSDISRLMPRKWIDAIDASNRHEGLPNTIGRHRANPGDAASRSAWFSCIRLRMIASNSITAARGSFPRAKRPNGCIGRSGVLGSHFSVGIAGKVTATIVAKFTLGAEHEGIELHVVAGQDWSPRAHMNPTAPETKCALRRLRKGTRTSTCVLILCSNGTRASSATVVATPSRSSDARRVCSVARWTFTGSIFWWSSSRISWPPSAQVA
jgi:hypothetical protein